ncbi:MAG: hypothetical protein LBI13_03605 [Streptococcaceae bacterium]|jgi:hypothetical protein|nr:hypothetical protein [Streptococcaceae bacterium]
MDYKEILKELGCEILRAETSEKVGLYIEEFNIIFLSANLDGIELENYTLHEVAHALSGDILTHLSSAQLKIVQEAKANRFMIQQQAEEWLGSYEVRPEAIDISNFLEYFHFPASFYDMAQKEFEKLLVND